MQNLFNSANVVCGKSAIFDVIEGDDGPAYPFQPPDLPNSYFARSMACGVSLES